MCLICFSKWLPALTLWYFKCFQSNESFEAKGNTFDTCGLINLCGCEWCCRSREAPSANSGATKCGICPLDQKRLRQIHIKCFSTTFWALPSSHGACVYFCTCECFNTLPQQSGQSIWCRQKMVHGVVSCMDRNKQEKSLVVQIWCNRLLPFFP